MATVPLSKAELQFTLQALHESIRVDGRNLASARRLGIRFGDAHGEVEVNFGPTRALGVCSGEVVAPLPERPNEGRLSFHVEFGTIASPSFDIAKPSAQAVAVANFVERLLKGSHAVDAEALCIVGGQKVWSIRVDVRALDDDGNLRDVCAIAALCSLLHFRKAEVEIRGESARVCAVEERVPVPLNMHHLPVPVTFALVPGADQGAPPTWILDPNRLEEAVMGGAICIAVNQHGELCAVHKPGGMPVDMDLIEHCVALAAVRAKELTSFIQKQLEADLQKRKEARRNVHQKYNADQLLTVDGLPSHSTAQAVPAKAAPPSSMAGGGAVDAAAAAAAPKKPGHGSIDPKNGASDGALDSKVAAELAAMAAEAAELEEQVASATAAEMAALAEANLKAERFAEAPPPKKKRRKRSAAQVAAGA